MREVLLRIRKGTVIFASGTMISRLTGFARDVATAALLGATKELALFFVAFRLANLFRRLLAETPLSSSVLPYAEKHPNQQKLFFQLTGFGFLSTTILVVLCNFALMFGTSVATPDWAEISRLTIIMLPSLLFLVGTSVNNAFLQLKGMMFPISVSSSLCNVVWLLVLPAAALFNNPGRGLAWGVLGGFVVQYLYTLYMVGRAYAFSWKQKEYGLISEIRPILVPFFLSLSGIAATQINNALDPIFATFALAEAPAYLWYAVRIYLLPLSLLGIAFLSASFPELARLYKEEDKKPFENLIEKGISYLFLVFIPLSMLIIFCSKDIISLIYYRGAFTMGDMEATSSCLSAYALGLAPYALVLFLSNVSYAEGEYRWPAIASFIGVASNITLNALFVFVFKLGAPSVALATSLASLINMILLMKKGGMKEMFFPCFASVAALFVTLNVPEARAGSQLDAFVHGFSAVCVFGTIYGLLFLGKKKAESRKTRP